MLQPPKDTPQFYPITFSGGYTSAIVSPGIKDKPDSWPWIPFASGLLALNRKVKTSGPRLPNGWAPTRPYFRSFSKASCGGYAAWAPYLSFDTYVTGFKDTLPSSDYALYASHVGEYLSSMSEYVNVPLELLAQVETELLNKLADRKVHLGNALAESKKTVGMIAQRTVKVLSAYRALRRGRIRDAAAILGVKRGRYHKELSGYWLEWIYGWLPLLNDIYGASEQLREWASDDGSAIVRVSRQVTRFSSHPSPSGPNSRYEGGCSVRVRGLAFYHVENEYMVQLSSLGLLNPLEIAWELTPWSFVIDWFLPVGNFLTALTADAGMKFVDGCFSIRADGVFEVDVASVLIPPGVIVHRNDLRVKNEAFAFERRKMSSPPSAHLYMKSPFTTNRVISAIALLTQLKGRG